MSSYLVPLLAVALGTLLGLLSTLLVSTMRQRQDITLRLLDQYFDVRKDVVNVVSDLSNLSIRNEIDSNRRAEYRHSVSGLFYKHNDFLPIPVLESLVLLYVCLAETKGGLYTIRGDAIVPMNDSEIISFIEDGSRFVNTRYFAPLALKSKNRTIRENQAIVLHARYVLNTLNKYVSIRDLLTITKRFKKPPNF